MELYWLFSAFEMENIYSNNVIKMILKEKGVKNHTRVA